MSLRYSISLVSLAVLLAACGPQTGTASDANAPAEPGAEAAQKRLPLPDCAEVEPADSGNAGWKMVDCRVQSSDGVGLAFEARYEQPAGGGEGKVRVQVVAAGDATLQTIEEDILNTFNHPFLQDIDGDGRDELLIPLVTGNVNTSWAIWRAKGAETQFVRLEELSGIDIDRTEDGFITTSARSSASSWEIGYWRMDGDDLEPVVTVSVSAEGVDADGNVLNETCTVTDAGGLAETGLTQEQAQAKFCAEEPADGVFQ